MPDTLTPSAARPANLYHRYAMFIMSLWRGGTPKPTMDHQIKEVSLSQIGGKGLQLPLSG